MGKEQHMRMFVQDVQPRYWLRPFSSKSIPHIVAMGLFYHAIGLILMNASHRIAAVLIPDYTSPGIPISVATTLAAGPIEESIFFGIPYLMTLNPYVLVGIGFVWSFLHLFNTSTVDFTSLSYGAFFFTIPHIFFSIRTWTSGKGWLAIVFHSGWNLSVLLSVCAAGLTQCMLVSSGDAMIKDILLVLTSAFVSILIYLAYKTKQKISYPRIYYLATLAALAAVAIPLAILNAESVL